MNVEQLKSSDEHHNIISSNGKLTNMEGDAPPRKRHSRFSFSLRCYSPRRAKISTSNIIAAYESFDFELDWTALMDSTLTWRERTEQGNENLKCGQITSLADLVMTGDKNFWAWSMKNRQSSSPSWRISKNAATLLETAENNEKECSQDG